MRPRKLTVDQVREIRASWKPQPSLAELGRRYGIDRKAVARIIKGETYKDVRC
jgi:hypothetical protein